MGIFNQILGNASEISNEKLDKLFQNILVSGEQIEKSYKIIRDLYVFTNKRLVLVDVQGLTGKKKEFLSIPYKNIAVFLKESAGTMDFDSELKLWVRGLPEPIVKKFKNTQNVDDIYQILSSYILE